jgi:glycosyltransferase involved in cell wall biosynthesis
LFVNPSTTSGGTAIKVVALIEAATVTGPAKNLIEFARRANASAPPRPDLPAVRLSIVTFQRGGVAPEALLAAAREARIEIDLLHERYRFDRAVIGQMRHILHQRAPDILQTHNVKSHFLVRFAGLHRRHRWLAFHHGYTTTDWKMLLYNQVDRWSLPSAGRVVTVCQPFARMLTRRGVSPERIAVLHNSTPFKAEPQEDAVAAVRARLGIPTGARVVLSVGRFSREKAQDDLLLAFEILRRRQSDSPTLLLLVGDGPERPRLAAMARAAGLEEAVIFAGQQRDVAPFYALASVLALPSHSEGSPNVLLEAMAAGVPVAVTAVGGVPEMVTGEESALVVPPRQPAQLAEALRRLLDDPGLASRLAASASARIADCYTPEVYHRKLLELYRDMMIAAAG